MQISDLKIAAMSVQYIQHSLEYTLHSFERLGLHNIELWGAEPHYYADACVVNPEDDERFVRLKNQLNKHGLKVVMFTPETLAYPYSYSHPEPQVRKRTIQYMVQACRQAVALGCKQVFINSGCGLRDLPREENWQRCRESFTELCTKAEEFGVDLVLEQLQPYESNLITSLEDCKRMLQEVNKPNLKICLDLVAMEVAGDTVDAFFDAFGDKIAHIHLADQNHEILGDGTYPLMSYLNALAEHEFKGYVSLEINDSIYWDDPHRSLEKSVEWLKSHKVL